MKGRKSNLDDKKEQVSKSLPPRKTQGFVGGVLDEVKKIKNEKIDKMIVREKKDKKDDKRKDKDQENVSEISPKSTVMQIT